MILLFFFFRFIEKMANQIQNEGSTANLFCTTAGSPAPKVTWQKDGKKLVITDRHFLLTESQRLFIVGLLLSDAGR